MAVSFGTSSGARPVVSERGGSPPRSSYTTTRPTWSTSRRRRVPARREPDIEAHEEHRGQREREGLHEPHAPDAPRRTKDSGEGYEVAADHAYAPQRTGVDHRGPDRPFVSPEHEARDGLQRIEEVKSNEIGNQRQRRRDDGGIARVQPNDAATQRPQREHGDDADEPGDAHADQRCLAGPWQITGADGLGRERGGRHRERERQHEA